MANTESDLETLLANWRKGDPSYSEMVLKDMREQWPRVYESLITNRHDVWMPKIEEFIASETVYFVIAGFLHMHGPDGLLRLLENSGYSVEQLR